MHLPPLAMAVEVEISPLFSHWSLLILAEGHMCVDWLAPLFHYLLSQFVLDISTATFQVGLTICCHDAVWGRTLMIFILAGQLFL